MNSAEPTQKEPDTIWMILKLMNSMFMSVLSLSWDFPFRLASGFKGSPSEMATS